MKLRHRHERDHGDRATPGEPATEDRLIIVRNFRRNEEPTIPRPRVSGWIAVVATTAILLLSLGMVGSLSRSPAPTEDTVTVTQRTSQRISRPSAIASVRASEPGAILEHATISPWERERFVDMEPFEFKVAVAETPKRSAPATTEPPIEVIETVPNVVGLPTQSAQKVLKDAGFSPIVTTTTTEMEMVGIVISQNGAAIVVGVAE